MKLGDHAAIDGRGQLPMELWGGVECTLNRVGDTYRDQFVETGHVQRLDDLDHIASLGIETLRYPVAWERVSPVDPGICDWVWSDQRIHRIARLGIKPIVGLVHHGSGPAYTDLLSDSFAPGLARHARNVAERYPWIEQWTPVNEPVTTARFSALYGHWYPHARDERSFWLALLNQIDATRMAMREIRRVNPSAQLVQTDDLGRTYGTQPVAGQVIYDNDRRWIGWDLLCGKVVQGHPQWESLRAFGFGERLAAIAADPCPPDVIGINHYLTSDRFLDHRVARYPREARGGNTHQCYADIAAVRVLANYPNGWEVALHEAWERYRLPLALTEVHNGCTREEQLRWFHQAWATADRLKRDGIDIRAVTAWALLGSSGWDTLLTEAGTYEPGAFDTSGGLPRPTAVAAYLRALSQGQVTSTALADEEGWWQRPVRFEHKPHALSAQRGQDLPRSKALSRPLLIAGQTGTLGQAFARTCAARGILHVLTNRGEFNLTDPKSVHAGLVRHNPWAVVNATGWVRVDEAERAVEECLAINHIGATNLADECGRRGIPSVTFSSDLVFDGLRAGPYDESDMPDPCNVYGLSKARAEEAIANLAGNHLIVRTAAFFSPDDPYNFAQAVVGELAAGRSFIAPSDEIVSPTYVPDLCHAVLDLMIDGESGIWHLTNGEGLSWAAFARAIAKACNLDTGLVRGVEGAQLKRAARRPANAALRTLKGQQLPSLDSAIVRFSRHRPPQISGTKATEQVSRIQSEETNHA